MAAGDRQRWTLVIEHGAGLTRKFVVRSATDGDDVMAALRAMIRDEMARGGCRSIAIGIHVEGPACDHEVK